MFLEKISPNGRSLPPHKEARSPSSFKWQKEEKFRLFNVRTTKHSLIHHRHIPYLSPQKACISTEA